MRLEHIEWVIATATCAALEAAIRESLKRPERYGRKNLKRVSDELTNCANELRARLQRTDRDPHVPEVL